MALKRPESVLVVIYDQHGDVLLLQRKDDPAFWQSVTGTLEHAEVPYQTAIREVAEETGIIVTDPRAILDCRHINQYPIRRRWRHRYPANEPINTEYVFSLQVENPLNIQLTEHLQYRWVTKQEACDTVWSSTNRHAIEKFVPEGEY